MTNNILINYIYETMIPEILVGIEEKYKDDLKMSYKSYLEKIYLDFDLNNQDVKEIAKVLIELENSKWKGKEPSIKLTEFLKDEALENIRHISNIGLKYAQSRMMDSNKDFTLAEETANNNIVMLENLHPKVKEFNKDLANIFVSEGILDFSYACGKTDNTSLRIGRIK